MATVDQLEFDSTAFDRPQEVDDIVILCYINGFWCLMGGISISNKGGSSLWISPW